MTPTKTQVDKRLRELLEEHGTQGVLEQIIEWVRETAKLDRKDAVRFIVSGNIEE